MTETIAVLVPFSGEKQEQLRRAAGQAQVLFLPPEKLEEHIENAGMIVGNPPPVLLARAKRLRLLQLESSGANLYAAPGVLPEGALLSCATGSYGPGIAEYMTAYVLALFLRLPQYWENQKNHRWQDEGAVRSAAGSTALVVGFGDIGSQFAMRFHALGGRVLGVCRTEKEPPPYAEALYTMEKLDALLPQADVVALSLPETPQTTGLMDARRLALMKRGAVLVNVGRGSAVVTDDLCAALREGRLGGAALDVTSPEPLPEDHPLWDMPNCILTPHISGGHHFEGTVERIFSVCLENVRRFTRGEPPVNLVDISTGYRESRP